MYSQNSKIIQFLFHTMMIWPGTRRLQAYVKSQVVNIIENDIAQKRPYWRKASLVLLCDSMEYWFNQYSSNIFCIAWSCFIIGCMKWSNTQKSTADFAIYQKLFLMLTHSMGFRMIGLLCLLTNIKLWATQISDIFILLCQGRAWVYNVFTRDSLPLLLVIFSIDMWLLYIWRVQSFEVW